MDMAYTMTAEEIAAGDEVSTKLEKMWGWFLAWGILSVLFGFFVISYKDVTVNILVYFFSAYFIAVGIFQLGGAIMMAKHRWTYLLMGVIWIAAGIIGFAWPHITIYAVSILIAWAFLLSGLVDIVQSLRNRHVSNWWIYLIRGLAAVVIAFLVLKHPNGTLQTLVVLLGIFSVLFGVIEIVASFSARHATKDWAAIKAQAG
jgi:uncharacterized membrane protein HdeD (DUF308 family)